MYTYKIGFVPYCVTCHIYEDQSCWELWDVNVALLYTFWDIVGKKGA